MYKYGSQTEGCVWVVESWKIYTDPSYRLSQTECVSLWWCLVLYIEAKQYYTQKKVCGEWWSWKKKVVPGLCFGIEINKLVKKDEST